MAILIEYCGPSFDENCCSLSMLAIVIVANCLHISLRCIILNNLYIHWFRLHLLTSNCLSILSNWLCWGQGLVSRWCINFGGILDGWFRCIFIEFVLNDWLTAGTFGYICCFGLILAFNGLRNLFNLLFNFLLNLLLFLDHVHLLFGFCLIYHIFLLSLTDFIGLFFKMRLFNLYFWRGRRFIRSIILISIVWVASFCCSACDIGAYYFELLSLLSSSESLSDDDSESSESLYSCDDFFLVTDSFI